MRKNIILRAIKQVKPVQVRRHKRVETKKMRSNMEVATHQNLKKLLFRLCRNIDYA